MHEIISNGLRDIVEITNSSALSDIHEVIIQWKDIAADLYWCPHCGFVITERVSRKDLIRYCWGPCLELYGEPLPLDFVRDLGPGAPRSLSPF